MSELKVGDRVRYINSFAEGYIKRIFQPAYTHSLYAEVRFIGATLGDHVTRDSDKRDQVKNVRLSSLRRA